MNKQPNNTRPIRKEPCPSCRKNNRDNSGDNFIVYENTVTGEISGHCFSCKYTKASSEHKKESYSERYEYELIHMGPFDVETWKQFKENTGEDPKGFRGLTRKTCQKYGVRHLYDSSGVVEFQYYPCTKNNDISGIKWRSADKKWNNMGSVNTTCELFGQASFLKSTSKQVILASGELDALSIYQVLSEYCATKGWEPPAVVSTLIGEGGFRQYQSQYEWLDKFDKIIVCPDQDEQGLKHLDTLMKHLPRNKTFIMELPLKDANLCLTSGKSKAILDGFFKPKSYTPSGVIGSDRLKEALLSTIKKVKIPLPPFLSQLQEMLRGGIRIPSIVNIVGPTGIGKSTYTNELIYFWIYNSPYTMGILSLEADSGEYSNVLVSRHLSVKLNLLNDTEAEDLLLTEEVDKQMDDLFLKEDGTPRFYLMEERDGKLENIKKLIEKLIIACGCKIIVIDPVQDLFAGLSLGEQEEFSSWLKITIKAYDVCFICINHIRKSQGGGVDARYSEQEVKGSSTLIQSSFLTILLNREKEADPSLSENEQKIIMSTMTHRVSKNRATGLTGDGGSLFYENTSHTLYSLEEYKKVNPELFEPTKSDY